MFNISMKFFSALFILFILLQGCEKETVEEKKVIRPVRAMQVSDVIQFRQRQFPGTAKPTQEVDLAFRVSGPLIELPVNVGDIVSKDDVVARIDPRDYEVQLNNARGQLDRANANAKRAQSDFEREMRILSEDADKYCLDVMPGEGRLVSCIKEHEAEVSEACVTALKETGLWNIDVQ